MIPIKQTVFTNVAVGKLGNCLAACLASLLELRLGQVPRFQLMKRKQNQRLDQFLNTHGCYTTGHFNGNPNGEGIDGFFIVGFSVVDQPGYYHCVIWKDGEIVHNPRDGVRLGTEMRYHDIRRSS